MSTTRWLLPILLLLAGCRPDASQGERASTPASLPDTTAAYLVVDAEAAQLFGAAAGDQWLVADSAAQYAVGGERYRLYGLQGALGEGIGTAASPPSETCTNPAIHIERERAGGAIAIQGAWDAMPRIPIHQHSQPVYREAMAERLRAHGIAEPEVRITQILRIDLDGDGVEEVLVSSNLQRGMGTSAQPGDHALVLLRRVIDGDIVTVPLREEFYPDGCVAECAPATLGIAGVVDANGDGEMEVILAFTYYEGEGRALYEIDEDGAREVLSWRCGV